MAVGLAPQTVTLPLRIQSESNLREHWSVHAKRVKALRTYVYYGLCHALGRECPYTLPLSITLTRGSPRLLDPGNLQAAFKVVQDATADYLAGHYLHGQDRQRGLTWQYAQVQTPFKVFWLTITFTPGEPDATAPPVHS